MKAKPILFLAASIVLVVISAAAYRIISKDEGQNHRLPGSEDRTIAQNVLSETFTVDEGSPVWLEIEPSKTTGETVRQILEAHNIKYELTGRGLNYEIYSSESGLPLWANLSREDTGGVIGLSSETNRVQFMRFKVKLCTLTVIETFGNPLVQLDYPPGNRPPTIYLHYPDLGLIFKIDESTNQIEWISLHAVAFLQETLPFDEYHAWDEYAGLFAGECKDNVQASEQ